MSIQFSLRPFNQVSFWEDDWVLKRKEVHQFRGHLYLAATHTKIHRVTCKERKHRNTPEKASSKTLALIFINTNSHKKKFHKENLHKVTNIEKRNFSSNNSQCRIARQHKPSFSNQLSKIQLSSNHSIHTNNSTHHQHQSNQNHHKPHHHKPYNTTVTQIRSQTSWY
jgi:hypothetical protein